MPDNSANCEGFSVSDFIAHKGQRAIGTVARHYGASMACMQYEPGKPTTVTLADGRMGAGTCLGCGSAPCMEKDDSELVLSGPLNTFPGNPSPDVCPTQAIRWDSVHSAAFVIASDCIGCGLCVARCPYGAISLEGGRIATVEATDPDGLIVAGPSGGKHPLVRRRGQIATLHAPAAANLPASVSKIGDAKAILLIRNLLNEIGLSARTRRRGDTNMRIDAIGTSPNGRLFVAEIEMSANVLDSPRALLEDVAVLHSRYSHAVDEIDPISIILSVPNVRAEYYQVIRDIEIVLGLRCRTITVGALIALLWNGVKIKGFVDDIFTIDSEVFDLSKFLEPLIGKKLPEPYPGAFRPVK